MKKRIAILSFYNGFLNRGVEMWAAQLQEKLGNYFEIEIFSGEKFGSTIKWDAKNYFYWRWLLLKHSLGSVSKWSQSDIVIPTNGTVQTVICRLVTWIFGKKMIVFGHAGPGADDKFNLLCSPDIFVAFSDYQKKWAQKYKFPWTRAVKIHHAVDIDKFTPALKKPNKKIVLCVAANTKDKRIELVRKAVGDLDEFKFIAVGKGNEIEVAPNKMPEIYKSSDVFCFVPEKWEAFGLVFLEALASNLPIVTIDDEVRREIGGNAGVFVKNPQAINSLSRAIFEAYNINWGNKPRNQAKKFSWENTVPEYKKLFNY